MAAVGQIGIISGGRHGGVVPEDPLFVIIAEFEPEERTEGDFSAVFEPDILLERAVAQVDLILRVGAKSDGQLDELSIVIPPKAINAVRIGPVVLWNGKKLTANLLSVAARERRILTRLAIPTILRDGKFDSIIDFVAAMSDDDGSSDCGDDEDNSENSKI